MNNTFTDFSLGLLITQALLIVSIILWIYCLTDVVRKQFHKNNKIVWSLVVIFLPIIGSVLYLCNGKSKKIKLN